MPEVQLALLAMELALKLYPTVTEAIRKGEVSPEEQLQWRTKFNELRNKEMFTGPEWEQSGK